MTRLGQFELIIMSICAIGIKFDNISLSLLLISKNLLFFPINLIDSDDMILTITRKSV